MSSCFGRRKADDTEPLLPKYEDDTTLQRRLHQKLHSYQMLRALGKGFMPSNDQLIINLRTLLASDVLNPTDAELSDSGRLLAKYTKQFLTHFIETLTHKNGQDNIQDFLWFLSKSSISVDTGDIARRAGQVKARADTKAAYASLRTVGSLLLTNSDFRIFLNDLQTVGKQIFSDTGFALSQATEHVAKEIEPSETEQKMLTGAGQDEGNAPSKEELKAGARDVTNVVMDEAVEVGQTLQKSAQEQFSDDTRETLVNRLQKAVTKLRYRQDYSDSVSTLTMLIKRYALIYSRAAEEMVNTAEADVEPNEEMDYAVRNFWNFLTSFGDAEAWRELESRFKKLSQHQNRNPDFEKLMNEVGNSVQKLLTDPDFLNNANQKFAELREKSKDVGTESDLRSDIDGLLEQLSIVVQSVAKDEDVSKMLFSANKLVDIAFGAPASTYKDILQDSINVFLPLVLSSIQYIPIPRLEVSAPEADILLENLILEPGKTINHTSFLPFRMRIETYNDLEIRRSHTLRTVSTATSKFTIKIDGISVAADEVGFWMRARSGFFSFIDSGIASFALDERGMDIHLDVEVGEEKLEKILTLKEVRVHVHKLNYQLRKSKLSWLAFLLKPLIRPIVRKVMEKQIANAIADFFHAANRELLYARERLRATRIADPKDMMTFFKAIAARLTPPEDPDLYARVGVKQPGKGVFKGRYAPGSVVKLWEEEARQAEERIADNEYVRGAWRNDIFDVHTVLAN